MVIFCYSRFLDNVQLICWRIRWENRVLLCSSESEGKEDLNDKAL